jgi:hypothetical protein
MTNFVEVGGRHVTNTPALVSHSRTNLLKELVFYLRRRKLLGEGNEVFDRE